MMDTSTFRKLPVEEVSRLVRASGPKVCVFPINGTRRWFLLEHTAALEDDDLGDTYINLAGKKYIELFQLFFDHGIDTLLVPIFGPELLARGDDYVEMAAIGMAGLVNHPAFVNFYDDYDVRVRFYGDHHKLLGQTPYAYLTNLFDRLTQETLSHNRCRLFFGVFDFDPNITEPATDVTIRYYASHGRAPNKRDIVEMYYGEYVKPVDLFIGFDRFCAFGMPLVGTGNEDLYFTVCPSLYLTQEQLRDILYDHLYARSEDGPDYEIMGSQDWTSMRDFYRSNQGKTMGVGKKYNTRGFWYPLPQVELPDGFAGSP
jgi:tuberculosinol/isotuberculosinol synthase